MLIFVLVVIIIGVATLIAITTMSESRKNANETAMRQDMIMVLNDARIYYRKPSSLGGGGNSLNGFSEDQVISIDPSNENGEYTISGTINSVTVQGISALDKDTLSVTGTMDSSNMDLKWSVD